MLTVVAALIEFECKILVCQRRRGDRFELMWEFPGGKVEPGEALEQALARELQEELGVTARIGVEILRLQHTHADRNEPFELVFFSAGAPRGEMQNLAFERIEWRRPEELPELDFLPADRDLVEKLTRGAIRLPPESDSGSRLDEIAIYFKVRAQTRRVEDSDVTRPRDARSIALSYLRHVLEFLRDVIRRLRRLRAENLADDHCDRIVELVHDALF